MFWHKEEEEPIRQQDEFFGKHADAAELLEILQYVPENYLEERQKILDRVAPETRGVLDIFAKNIIAASQKNDVPMIVEVWQRAKAHIQQREAANKLADEAMANKPAEPISETKLFTSAAEEIFGADRSIEVKGRPVISSRSGGILWSLGQDLQALLDKRPGEEGKRYIKRIKDDYLHLTPEGIVFFNPDDPENPSDGLPIPWSDFHTLTFESNASTVVDPINIKLRPLLKSTAQSSWQPLGSVRVIDRGNGRTLAEMRMPRPNVFVEKVKALGKIMIQQAIHTSPTEAKFTEPLTKEMFLAMLSPSQAEKIQAQIHQYRENKN